MILIDAERIAASRPNRPLFAGLSVTLNDGDRLGVVGLNGAGKSTLLRILAGELQPEAGDVRWGRGARIGFLPQNPTLPAGTVLEVVGEGWQPRAMLDRLGMTSLVEARTDTLSGGEAKRTALARLLVGEHDVLVLDEPTNHLDLDAIQFLERWLGEFRGGLVLVTHDRHVLDAVTTRALELDRGKAYLHIPDGWHAGSGYAAYLAGRAEREEQAESDEQTRRNLARRELAWLRRGAPARTSKPKARIAAASAVVQSRPDAPMRPSELGLALGSKRLGSRGIELHDVAFSWPGGRTLIEPVSVSFQAGDRVGVVGPNGAGKSTLLDIVAGRLVPSHGRVDRGATVKIGYYDQLGRDLDPAARVRDVVAGEKGEPSLADLSLMRRFWFDGDVQFAPIATLSGGERRRLQLLLTLVDQPNVLLLDEPTNDLDLDTLRAIEDFLENWKGIVVAVSHDRAFLDRVTDELLALDGRGGVRWVRGGVAAWLAERSASAADATSATDSPRTAPRRVKPAGAGRSPSTVRRQLGQAERELTAALTARDDLVAQIEGARDHLELASLGERLTAAEERLDAAEEAWLALATEAEALGLT
jgi:ATP-binding cassette subfamily F protein uup